MIESGAILLTRNADRRQNRTPGYWNHAAIWTSKNVVEAQTEPGRVIVSEHAEFWGRYPEILVLGHDHQAELAKAVQQSLGAPYWKRASLFLVLRPSRFGENCVSVVRRAWLAVTGEDPGWHRPDHIESDSRLRVLVRKSSDERSLA